MGDESIRIRNGRISCRQGEVNCFLLVWDGLRGKTELSAKETCFKGCGRRLGPADVNCRD